LYPDYLAVLSLQPLDQLEMMALALLQLPEEHFVDFAIIDWGNIQGRKLF
jgi:hypothetical protein